ncbi:MAG: nucleotidyltransferase family protein [Hyphomicrobiales bacterium]
MTMPDNTLPATTSMSTAMNVLNALPHQFLVALDEGRIVGTLTDGDIRRAILRGVGLEAPVEEAMNKTPVVALSKQSSAELRDLMLLKQVRHLPLVDNSGLFVGIVGLDELQSGALVDHALLMVGGLGTRLRPHTETVPKPMLQIGGLPLLETMVGQLRSHGFTKITLSINYLGEQIRSYFGDGSEFNVTIDYVTEPERMGTVGAVSLMHKPATKPLMIMNGDILTAMNFRAFMDFHLSTGADLTMGVRTYKQQIPYGVVNTRGLNITSIEEKPELEFFVNAGLYVVEPAVLADLPKRPMDMTDLVADLLKDDNRQVTACPIHEYWQDIGREDDLIQARKEYQAVFSRSGIDVSSKTA